MVNRLRALIDRYECGPVVAAIAITLAPFVAFLQVGVLANGDPWWYPLASVVGLGILGAWTVLVIAAVTRWFGR
jgi:hypothetical protein